MRKLAFLFLLVPLLALWGCSEESPSAPKEATDQVALFANVVPADQTACYAAATAALEASKVYGTAAKASAKCSRKGKSTCDSEQQTLLDAWSALIAANDDAAAACGSVPPGGQICFDDTEPPSFFFVTKVSGPPGSGCEEPTDCLGFFNVPIAPGFDYTVGVLAGDNFGPITVEWSIDGGDFTAVACVPDNIPRDQAPFECTAGFSFVTADEPAGTREICARAMDGVGNVAGTVCFLTTWFVL